MEPLIKEILNSQHPIPELTARGWVRTRRASGKAFCFVEINDGSCLANLQVIAANDLPNYNEVESLQTGASVAVSGSLVPSQGKGQKWELQARSLSIVGNADESYPLQKKGTQCGVPQEHRPSEATHQSLRQRVPGAQPYGLRHPQFFSGAGISICAYPDHHRQRL